MMNQLDDFFSYFAGSGFEITTAVLVMITMLVFIVLLIFVPTLTKKVFPRFGYAKYANYIPFQTVFTDNSMELTDGSLIRVYKISGLQTSMLDNAAKEKYEKYERLANAELQ